MRLGSQVVTSQDDSATAWHVTPSGTAVQDLSNTVFGLDGDVRFKKYFNFRWEWARSAHVQDTDVPQNQTEYGNALRLEPSFSSRFVNFRYLYYYVQPSFYTDVGSASTDKVQHQFTLDLRLDRVRLSWWKITTGTIWIAVPSPTGRSMMKIRNSLREAPGIAPEFDVHYFNILNSIRMMARRDRGHEYRDNGFFGQ